MMNSSTTGNTDRTLSTTGKSYATAFFMNVNPLIFMARNLYETPPPYTSLRQTAAKIMNITDIRSLGPSARPVRNHSPSGRARHPVQNRTIGSTARPLSVQHPRHPDRPSQSEPPRSTRTPRRESSPPARFPSGTRTVCARTVRSRTEPAQPRTLPTAQHETKDTTRHDTARHDMIDTAWPGTKQNETARHETKQHEKTCPAFPGGACNLNYKLLSIICRKPSARFRAFS